MINKVKCDRPTDQPTNRPTDKAGCRVACKRLKRAVEGKEEIEIEKEEDQARRETMRPDLSLRVLI